MKFAEFAENINQVYSGKFAHSACIVRPYNCLGRYIHIDCMLAEDPNEVFNRIAENDMFKISFCIDLPDNFNFETDELPENLTMEARANSYIIKPENEYLYCNYKKIPYRKSKGTAEKLVSVFGKFVDKLHTQIVEDLHGGNIHENFKALVKTKI